MDITISRINEYINKNTPKGKRFSEVIIKFVLCEGNCGAFEWRDLNKAVSETITIAEFDNLEELDQILTQNISFNKPNK